MFTAKSTKQSKFNLTLHNKTARLRVIYHNYFNHHQFISFDERCAAYGCAAVQFNPRMRAEMSVGIAAAAGAPGLTFNLVLSRNHKLLTTFGHRLPVRALIANKYRPSRLRTPHP